MITSEQLYDIKWTDSYLENVLLVKEDSRWNLSLVINDDEIKNILFIGCYYITMNMMGDFFGKESIMDVSLLSDSKLIHERKSCSIPLNIQEIEIKLNSGGMINCLITDKSFMKVE